MPFTSFANWTMPAFTNAQAWGSSITATGTVREHTQVVTQYTTNAPVTWTNFYWRFDEGATSNDYTETDGETYTNLIVDIGVPDRTNTMLLSGRDAAMWELYLAQIERAQVVGDVPTQSSFYWHTDYITNLQARKDWIEANAGNWVCTTNADSSYDFSSWINTNSSVILPMWTISNLLENVSAPTNWLDYTPTWPAPRIATNRVTLIGTNVVVTNAFWFGNLYTNLTGTNGQIVSIVLTNELIAEGFEGRDYQKHDIARQIMDKLVVVKSDATIQRLCYNYYRKATNYTDISPDVFYEIDESPHDKAGIAMANAIDEINATAWIKTTNWNDLNDYPMFAEASYVADTISGSIWKTIVYESFRVPTSNDILRAEFSMTTNEINAFSAVYIPPSDNDLVMYSGNYNTFGGSWPFSDSLSFAVINSNAYTNLVMMTSYDGDFYGPFTNYNYSLPVSMVSTGSYIGNFGETGVVKSVGILSSSTNGIIFENEWADPISDGDKPFAYYNAIDSGLDALVHWDNALFGNYAVFAVDEFNDVNYGSPIVVMVFTNFNYLTTNSP